MANENRPNLSSRTRIESNKQQNNEQNKSIENRTRPSLTSRSINRPQENETLNKNYNTINNSNNIQANNTNHSSLSSVQDIIAPKKEENTTTTIDNEPEKKPKKKKSKLWLKILILILVVVVFLFACLFAGYSIYSYATRKDPNTTYTKVEILTSGNVDYQLRSCNIEDASSQYESFDVTKKDLNFKWNNGSIKSYELAINLDKNCQFRFRYYNLFEGVYTSENLFKINFETYTANFDTKFILREDGYYYLNTKNLTSTKITLIFTIEFNIEDYHNQFGGRDVDAILKLEQSSNPSQDWGYYSYLFDD